MNLTLFLRDTKTKLEKTKLQVVVDLPSRISWCFLIRILFTDGLILFKTKDSNSLDMSD